MKEDIDRWNAKFAGREAGDTPSPDALLATTPHLPGGGLALDLASGSGQNAVWLAMRGFDVTAVDGSLNGMRLALSLARRCGVAIRPVVADLDAFEMAGSFDLVVVMNYLNRPLYRRLHRFVSPGGILIVKTFNRDFLDSHPRFNPAYVLDDGELPGLIDGLTVIEHAESPPGDAGRSHLVCRR